MTMTMTAPTIDRAEVQAAYDQLSALYRKIKDVGAVAGINLGHAEDGIAESLVALEETLGIPHFKSMFADPNEPCQCVDCEQAQRDDAEQGRPTPADVVNLLRRLDALDRTDPQDVAEFIAAKRDLLARIEREGSDL